MPDPESPTPAAGLEAVASQVAGALSDILRQSGSPEVLQVQQLLLQRLALQGDVFSSRIPVPKNITEVGGYMNLLATLGESEIRTQALAAALGVAGPNPMPGLVPSNGTLFDVTRANDRPEGAAQASIPLQVRVRNDFAAGFDAARQALHETGCSIPLLGFAPAALPPATPGGDALPEDLLLYLGRVLRLMPTAALLDPDADPLALAREDGATQLQVVARQLDAGAPSAGSVAEASWVAWSCDATSCTESTDDRSYLPLAPILNAAGWYQPAPDAPSTLADAGAWWRWTNTTGLVPGVTLFGDELLERHAASVVGGSALRDALHLVWNGEAFVAP
jgi:hypothetical protein